MPRKLFALLPALALALCYARAGSWVAAASRGDAHACCGHGAPVNASTLTDCCVTPAAAGAVHIVRVDAPAILAALPVPHSARRIVALVANIEIPWGRRADRSAAPARAPPRA